MSYQRNSWRRSAFKCVLLVVGLVLFSAQLSYKFYLFANLLPYQAGYSDIKHSITIKSVPGTPGFHCDLFLLLDKRYDRQPTHTLLTPIFQVQHFSIKTTRRLIIPTGNAIYISLPASSLRGPPFIQS